MGDSLKYALHRARIPGSFKTQFNHRYVCMMFVDVLRENGSHVQKWYNVSNKHVAIFVEHLVEQDASVGTIKTYLSSIRVVCASFGNLNIHPENEKFGIGRRELISNTDRSVPENTYLAISEALAAHPDVMHRRVGAQIDLMRFLGTRREETWKLRMDHLQSDNRLLISDGAKGGRARMTPEPLDTHQLECFHRLMQFANSTTGTTIPDGLSEREFKNKFEYIVRSQGLTRKSCGASVHGLRHAFLQQVYQQKTGWPARVKFASYGEFVQAAHAVAGDDWPQVDGVARAYCLALAGHGTGRADVIAAYLGSSSR